MIKVVVIFLLGVLTGAVTLMVVSCMSVSNKCSREEELKEWERKLP